MTAPAGLTAAIEVAHEASATRIAPDQRPDGSVDLHVDGGDPLRVALLCGRDVAGRRAAMRGIQAGGAELAIRLDVTDPRSFVDRAAALREAGPELVVVLAADRPDAGAVLDLAEALRFSSAARSPAPRVLVYADARGRARAAAACAPLEVEALPDLRGLPSVDALVARVRALRRGDRPGLVLRDEALEAAARGLASASGVDTVLLDVTGGSSSIVHVRTDGALTAAHARLGVGTAADRVVARAGLDRVRRWIPRAVEAPALLERVFNRARWPGAVPASLLALTLEMSLAREALTHVLADLGESGVDIDAIRRAGSIVMTGRLAAFPRRGQSVLVAIDALEPTGCALVSRDRRDVLVARGALAARGHEDEGFGSLAEPLALVAAIWPKRSATLRVVGGDGAVEERVGRGAFFLIPTTGAVDVSASGADVRAHAEALTLGVIADARGRPLVLPPRDAERLPTLARWISALDALPREAT